MDTLRTLQAFDAVQAAGRELVFAQGLPAQVREGAALCAYTWAAGELAGVVEADGTRLAYRYGADGRLLAVQRNDQPWARYGYDDAGRLATVDRTDGPLAHQYDAQGQLIRTLRGDASPWVYRWQGGRVCEARSDAEHSRFEHDAQGRLVGLQQRVAGVTLSLRFDFDAQGRLSTIAWPEWQHTLAFDWDAQGRPAAVAWNDRTVVRLGTDDAQRLSWTEGLDGVRAETWHEATTGRPLRQCFSRNGQLFWASQLVRDDAFRLVQEGPGGQRRHRYDAQGRLVQTEDGADGAQVWRYQHDLNDAVSAEGDRCRLQCDAQGRVQQVLGAAGERVYRHNQAGELLALLHNGQTVARCLYDHKGRLVQKTGADGRAGTERYLYGPDDALLAVADGQGRPLLIMLRLPTGLVGAIDFRRQPRGEPLCLHADHAGNLLFIGAAGGELQGPLAYDPWGVPLPSDPLGPRGPRDLAESPDAQAERPSPSLFPPVFRARLWHADLGLYRIGCRWYSPQLRRFLTPDTHTGAPDDARLLNPFVLAGAQRLARAQVLGDWLRQPRLRHRVAYCSNDPVNRFDPNGHWSFGGVLLSLLGVLWTLPNTAFGLAIEVSCLIGEVLRWLVYAFSLGHVSWQTPGFDVAASGRLNAFALVFKGGWLGSFDSLLGITFGNVIFVNGEYEQNAAFKALPDPVAPPAYGGTVTIPKAQALYEHELRHVNQYSWWGPFFHLGLPLFGIYEWDVILNGYQDASLEKDAREHSGF